MDQPTGSNGTLVLFDFDGTLVDLATDYAHLNLELDAIDPADKATMSSGLLQRLLKLYGSDDLAEAAAAMVDRAEARGLEAGRTVPGGARLYSEFAESRARIAVVTHNGRRVVDAFFSREALRRPDAVFDLRALGAPKHESATIRDYVKRLSPIRRYLVGNDDSDRALAQAVSAEYIDAHDF